MYCQHKQGCNITDKIKMDCLPIVKKLRAMSYELWAEELKLVARSSKLVAISSSALASLPSSSESCLQKST
jgi:hypothetical protein